MLIKLVSLTAVDKLLVIQLDFLMINCIIVDRLNQQDRVDSSL